MRAARPRLVGILALALSTVLVVACTQTTGTARGIITAVEGTIDDVTAFTLLADGSEIRFATTDDADYGFPLSHLREHQRTGDPVLVEWEMVGTVRYALSVIDG